MEWVKNTLKNTPENSKIVVFSHVPPLPVIHYWSDQIRNGERLIQVLEDYQKNSRGKILAYVHGHNHADQIFTERAFPIISLGCNKCEYFIDKKPEGSFTPERHLGTVTQDLWDIMIIKPQENTLEFVRFGAGEDKSIKL